ncbi:MAG: hypothetical protein IPQ02_02065 [Saprospiraceae bacterium]|nr:hypothetical protein [Candidatus Defluviibacterium haderslevense]
MKAILIVITLIALSVQTFGQKANVIGSWSSPIGLGITGYGFEFDSSGVVIISSGSCLWSQEDTGRYYVTNDSIFISYFPKTNETNPSNWNTKSQMRKFVLTILDRHTLDFGDDIYLNDIELHNDFSLNYSVFRIGQCYYTDQILFDSNDFILPQSYPFLDTMVYFLKSHKNFNIKIHRTGEKSTEENGPLLSQIQVDLVGDFLEKKGINRNRLTPIGYFHDRGRFNVNESSGLAKILEEMFYAILRELDYKKSNNYTGFIITEISYNN